MFEILFTLHNCAKSMDFCILNTFSTPLLGVFSTKRFLVIMFSSKRVFVTFTRQIFKNENYNLPLTTALKTTLLFEK